MSIVTDLTSCRRASPTLDQQAVEKPHRDWSQGRISGVTNVWRSREGLAPRVESGRRSVAGEDGGDLLPQQGTELEHAAAAPGDDDRAALPLDDERLVRRIGVAAHRRPEDAVPLDVRQVRAECLEHGLCL